MSDRFIVDGFCGGEYAGVCDRKMEVNVSHYTEKNGFTRIQLEQIAEELNAKYAAAQQPAPPQPEPAASEQGHLIERAGLCLGFCEHKPKWVTFTDDQALRFARRSDAIRFIEAFREQMDLQDVLVTEHIWR